MTQRYETLQTLLERRLGVKTRPRLSPAGFQIGASIAQVLRQTPNRVAAVIINLSVNELFVSPDGITSATHGIRLSPSGGALTLLWDEDFDMVGYEWNAIASGAASDVFVLEVLTLSTEVP